MNILAKPSKITAHVTFLLAKHAVTSELNIQRENNTSHTLMSFTCVVRNYITEILVN